MVGIDSHTPNASASEKAKRGFTPIGQQVTGDAFNDGDDEAGDEQVATQPDLSKVSLMTSWGGKPVEFDVANDEGLSGALRHIQGIRTGMDAADSRENIRQSEFAADKHNSQFENQLKQMAKARKLKVKHQGIGGGSYLIDYGA